MESGIRVQEVLSALLTARLQRSIRWAPSDPMPVLDPIPDLGQIQAEGSGAGSGIRAQEALPAWLTARLQRSIRWVLS
ncbi:MAG TPA: hypothetical protein VJU02_08740, partial [Nitrospiraceae bacterium]|nr:hypothetical protein [Nitrospiraceae bacterium]